MRTREEVTGEWRKLHYEELYGMYALPNFIRVIKSRITRRAGHLALWGKERKVQNGFWWEDLMELDHLEDPDVDERAILRRLLRKWDVGHGLD